jgi:hypothetical protein
MSISQRQHIRFSLDIPAIRFSKFGERHETVLQQISIGGCLLDWDENIFTGEVFRLEIKLANGNWLPLTCKVLYKFENSAIGAKFVDISRFEQELVGKIITHSLEKEGLPMQVDPFSQPPKFVDSDLAREPQITDQRRVRDDLLEQIMSGDT